MKKVFGLSVIKICTPAIKCMIFHAFTMKNDNGTVSESVEFRFENSFDVLKCSVTEAKYSTAHSKTFFFLCDSKQNLES